MARLIVVRGADVGREIVLPAYPSVIGREAGCDIVLDDPRASRQHAVIRIERGAWVLRDLETENGTHVDGRRAEGWTPLERGARIQVGRTLLRFEGDAHGDAPPPLPARGEGARAGFPDIPGYEILERVGMGAGGTVYRARQRALDRLEAVKVLSPKLAERPGHVDRFIAEARAAAALSHPNVIPVYDVGAAGGMHYFTMEFMEGGTVEDLLLTRPGSRLPWRDAVALASAAARGIAYVHQQGFVHRDVKPANLLLDARGIVKLGDMGTVVRVDDAARQRIGTPHFMSPEQARREAVTRASDVYSLGATLYRMLAGRTPHKGADLRDIIRAVGEDEPFPIERLCRGLPDEVTRAVHEMMARDPRARPTDAAAVGQRLAAALDDVAVARRSRKRARRVRSGLSDWGIRLLLMAAVAAALWFVREPLLEALHDALR